MRLGLHLPQYGRAASGAAVARVAIAADDAGIADVWVSDHVAVPAAQSYPSPYLLDPIVTLTAAAAVTRAVGLGTSVMVAPQHHPLWLAKALASVDVVAGGRVIAGLGVGWSKAEFAALDRRFEDRGRRTDEIVDVLRACWTQDPVTHHGAAYHLDAIRVLPQPTRSIPIWIGGGSEPAFRRGIERGDGFQIIGVTPQQAVTQIARLRSGRPETTFTISLRTGWDPQGMDPDVIRREAHAFAAAGVQHVVSAPWRSSVDDWLRSMDQLVDILEGEGLLERRP